MGEYSRELSPVVYAELAVGAAEVRFDRLGAEEELDGGFAGGGSVGDHQRYAELLRREPVRGGGVATRANGGARGLQLSAGALGPGLGPELLEHSER